MKKIATLDSMCVDELRFNLRQIGGATHLSPLGWSHSFVAQISFLNDLEITYFFCVE